MAYYFYKVNSVGGILPPLKEQQYGSAQVIKFTNLDSCIGVVAKKGNGLCGVHLILEGVDQNIPETNMNARAATGAWFNSGAAREILDRLFEHEHTFGGIVGHIDLWERSDIPEVRSGFRTLISGFKYLDRKQLGPAQCMGVRLIGGKINFFYYNLINQR
ncbi:MAG: hypothetical protein WCE64_06235 [Bacteroidales bacterium]